MGLVGDWHDNPVLEFPITIGTHPIQDLPLPEPINKEPKQTDV